MRKRLKYSVGVLRTRTQDDPEHHRPFCTVAMTGFNCSFPSQQRVGGGAGLQAGMSSGFPLVITGKF